VCIVEGNHLGGDSGCAVVRLQGLKQDRWLSGQRLPKKSVERLASRIGWSLLFLGPMSWP
jgi:hypothetical protein